VICGKLELQALKFGWFSVGWFILAARLVRVHLDFAHHGIKQCSCSFQDVTNVALTRCLHWYYINVILSSNKRSTNFTCHH